jgi:hypothetical protein
MRPRFENKAVRVADLVVTTDVVRETDFVNCQIIGPAIVYFENCTLVNVIFTGNLEAMLYEVEESRPIQGVVVFDRCLFDQSRFERIGLIGTAELLAPIRAMPEVSK